MSSRVIAVGDIHGCAVALRGLLEAIQIEPEETLVVLGDVIDRGPQSREVIEELIALREKCRLKPILGNHEEMLLNFVDCRPQPDDWLECGGASTLASYGSQRDASVIPQEHIAFLRSWGDCYETNSHFFVHASYEPTRPLTEQRWQTLRWHSLRFGIPGPHVSGRTAIVGHTSLKDGEILDLGYLICIDTFCCGGGWLTALDTSSGETWQVDREGRLRE